jgi:hypothetical protein
VQRLSLVFLSWLAACATASCTTSGTTDGPSAEGGLDASTMDEPAANGGVDAAPDSGHVCPTIWDLGNPDAGGICCCRGDLTPPPVCDADGGSPTCPAGFDLHHDQECDPATWRGPCTLPQGLPD